MSKLLFGLFLLAISLRFLFFPADIYFAFDQARDAFQSLEVASGHFKITGPPSAASDKLFPGPLVFYLAGPVLKVFDKNPMAVAALYRIINSLGVFVVFLIGLNLFNKWVGLIAAFFYAISFEQSQYSLFLSHQPLAVVPVLLFFLGLILLFFKSQTNGLVLSAIGLGLAIQFHYVY